jgi:hypothetical protein
MKQSNELLSDEKGSYRIINGEKIYQIEEISQREVDLNKNINLVRSSGMTPSQYLKSKYLTN